MLQYYVLYNEYFILCFEQCVYKLDKITVRHLLFQ